MEHSYFKDRISAYHDRELKHEEERLIREHLEQCAECRQFLAEFEKLDRMVEKHSQLAGDEYWEESARRIEAAIGPETSTTTEVTSISPYSWKNLGWKLAAVAASVAALAFIAFHEGDLSREIRQKVGLEPSGEKKAIIAPAEKTPPHAVRVMELPLRPDTAKEVIAEGQEQAEKGKEDTLRVSDEMTAERYAIPEAVPLKEQTGAVSKEAIATSPIVSEPVGDMEPAELEGLRETGAGLVRPPSDTLRESDADTYQFPAMQVVQDAGLVSDATAQAKSKITVDSGETRIVTQMERKDAELGSEITVRSEAPLVDLEDEISPLEMWRAKRDSLRTKVTEATKVRVLKRESTSPATATERATSAVPPEAPDTAEKKTLDKQQLRQVLDSVYNEEIKNDPQYLLLEAHYQVALLTDDEREREKSVKYLRDYLESEESAYKLQAAWYLQQLGEIE